MQWSVSCIKRKQFAQWAIPKALRDALGIQDGDRFLFAISHLDFSEDLSLQVTSGGELLVPARVAQLLKRQAELSPSSSVNFAVRLSDLRETQEAFDKGVAASQMLSDAARSARLAQAPKEPRGYRVVTTVFERNPDVVAEVLARARGTCERCKNPAPFKRRSDGSLYLEVHHRIQLAHGGKDTVDNAEALCPNCHRWSHYGQLDA